MTILPDRPNEYVVVGDALRATHPELATTFLSKHELPKEQGLPSRGDTNLKPYADGSGALWVEGFGEIKNSQGETVGGIGVIFNAAPIEKVQRAIREEIWQVFLLSYAVTFAFVYFFSRLLAQPIARLTRIASRVGQGDYTENFAEFGRPRLRDEISTLGAVFAHMVEQIRNREQNLKHEVQSLRIEIDGARKAKEVREIVETDFFRDLKGKANGMRQRARGAGNTLLAEGNN